MTAGNKLKILAGTAGFLFLVKATAGWFLGKYFVSPDLNPDVYMWGMYGMFGLQVLLFFLGIGVLVFFFREKKGTGKRILTVLLMLFCLWFGWGDNAESTLYLWEAAAAPAEASLVQDVRGQGWLTVLSEKGQYTGVDWTEGNVTLNRELSLVMCKHHENRHGEMVYFVYFGLPSHKEPHESWDDFEECFYGPLFAAGGQKQPEG